MAAPQGVQEAQNVPAARKAPTARKGAKGRKATASAAGTLPPAEAPAELQPSEAATQIINWILASGDNGGLPFMVIDKVAAEVIAFDGEGKRAGLAAALVGITPGDDSAPGVGDREKLSDIPVQDRTTPAGRFVAKFGLSGKEKVLWVDYVTSISLHPVITTNKTEHRLERLNSPTPDDNRITFGCINVPPRFYQKIVMPLFKRNIGIVYILPEIKTLAETFPAFQAQRQGTAR
jgi:hypothetical protein